MNLKDFYLQGKQITINIKHKIKTKIVKIIQ